METINEGLAVKEEEVMDVFEKEIDDEVVQEIIKLSDDVVSTWAKPTKGGFMINDRVIPEITGRIVDVRPYYVRWNNKTPEKILFNVDSEVPEGYELRVDLILLIDDMLVGVSLSKSSSKFQLSPYVRYLKNSGLKINQIITKLQTKQAANKFGEFTLVTFHLVAHPHVERTISIENDVVSTQETASSSINTKTDPWA